MLHSIICFGLRLLTIYVPPRPLLAVLVFRGNCPWLQPRTNFPHQSNTLLAERTLPAGASLPSQGHIAYDVSHNAATVFVRWLSSIEFEWLCRMPYTRWLFVTRLLPYHYGLSSQTRFFSYQVPGLSPGLCYKTNISV